MNFLFFVCFFFRICDEIVPILIEKNCLSGIAWTLESFTDISDVCLLKILVHCLKNINDVEHKQILSTILQRNVVQNVKLFRNHSSFQCTVNLMTVINESLNESVGEANILNWASLCLDAYYQRFLLIKDTSTLELLKSIRTAVSLEVNLLTLSFCLLFFFLRKDLEFYHELPNSLFFPETIFNRDLALVVRTVADFISGAQQVLTLGA